MARGSRIGTWVTGPANTLLASLFEPPCAACRRPLRAPLEGAVCADCWRSVQLVPHLQHRSEGSPVAWWSAVGEYEGRLKEMIHALKYERRRSIARPLGALMRECATPLLHDADLIVPVPLHPRRAYQRGFNQADDLARQLGLPVMSLLRRTRHTQSQIELPKHQREENVKGAFELTAPRSRLPAPGIVVLVDDVSTTGSTLDACARVLRAAGMKEVRAVTAARVVNERR